MLLLYNTEKTNSNLHIDRIFYIHKKDDQKFYYIYLSYLPQQGFRFQVFQQLLYGTDEADGIYDDTILNTCGNDAVKEKIADVPFFNLGKAGGNLT